MAGEIEESLACYYSFSILKCLELRVKSLMSTWRACRVPGHVMDLACHSRRPVALITSVTTNLVRASASLPWSGLQGSGSLILPVFASYLDPLSLLGLPHASFLWFALHSHLLWLRIFKLCFLPDTRPVRSRVVRLLRE